MSVWGLHVGSHIRVAMGTTHDSRSCLSSRRRRADESPTRSRGRADLRLASSLQSDSRGRAQRGPTTRTPKPQRQVAFPMLEVPFHFAQTPLRRFEADLVLTQALLPKSKALPRSPKTPLPRFKAAFPSAEAGLPRLKVPFPFPETPLLRLEMAFSCGKTPLTTLKIRHLRKLASFVHFLSTFNLQLSTPD